MKYLPQVFANISAYDNGKINWDAEMLVDSFFTENIYELCARIRFASTDNSLDYVEKLFKE